MNYFNFSCFKFKDAHYLYLTTNHITSKQNKKANEKKQLFIFFLGFEADVRDKIHRTCQLTVKAAILYSIADCECRH
jgi:hypothetical protein